MASCTPCDRAHIYATSLKICQRSAGKEACRSLYRRAVKGNISPEEMIESVKKKVKGDKKAETALHEVESFLKRIRAEKA
jgi:hypothetical protein